MFTDGFAAIGDGGGGAFVWNASDTRGYDGGTVIPVTGITTGRWNRLAAGPLNVKWFGAKGDGVTDDTTALQLAFTLLGTYAYQSLYFPPGNYLCSQTLTIPHGATVFGDGQNTIVTKTTPGDLFQTQVGHVGPYVLHDLNLQNTATWYLNNWAPSTAYTLGTIVQVLGSVVLKCTAAGTSGAYRPVGQLTWISQWSTSGPPYVGPTVTISGNPSGQAWNFLVMITAGGTANSATYKWSTNNGATWTSATASSTPAALGTTGHFITFGAGTYSINTLCASPTFGWSSAVGTVITDGTGTLQWTVMDGGAGLDTINSGVVKAYNLSIFGFTVGICVDGSEQVKCENLFIQTTSGNGFAAIWLAQSYSTESQHYGTQYASTNDVAFDRAQIYGYPYWLVDDGGQQRSFRNINSELASNGMHLANSQNTLIDTVDMSDGCGTCVLGGGQAQSPYVPAANTGGLYFGVGGFQLVMKNCGVGTTTGLVGFAINAEEAGGYSSIQLEGNLFGTSNTIFTGVANLDSFTDLGGNYSYQTSAVLVDAMPKTGVFLSGYSANTAYKGLGVNQLPPTIPGLGVTGGLFTGVTDVPTGSSSYIVDSGTFPDLVLLVHPASSGTAITVPAPVKGRHLFVVDEDGTSNTKPITLTPASGTIDGASNLVLDTPRGALHLVGNAAGTNWDVVARPAPLKSVSANVDVSAGATPGASVYDCDIIRLTGTMTGNVTLNLPSLPGRIWFIDMTQLTDGGHNLSVFTGSGGCTVARSIMWSTQNGVIVACVAANVAVRLA